MIIAIDHGNKSIKTKNHTFTAGLVESDDMPPILERTMLRDGQYYSLSSRRIPYMRDKTADERFFNLTLIAIAKEIETQNVYEKGVTKEIELLVGLPPSHFGAQREGFIKYFLRNKESIDYVYENKDYSIHINSVNCYPQAFSAAISEFKTVKLYEHSFVIDIGGYTLDYLQMFHGKADTSFCDSLNDGIITMYNLIKSNVNAKFGISVSEQDIDGIIKRNQSSMLSKEVVDMVLKDTDSFIAECLDSLNERKIDLRNNFFIFAGGGSVLLYERIVLNGKIRNLKLIDNVRANVNGYEILYFSQQNNNLEN